MFAWLTYWDMLGLGGIDAMLGRVAFLEIEALLKGINGATGLIFTVAAFGSLLASRAGGFISTVFNGRAHGGLVLGYGILSIFGWAFMIARSSVPDETYFPNARAFARCRPRRAAATAPLSDACLSALPVPPRKLPI